MNVFKEYSCFPAVGMAWQFGGDWEYWGFGHWSLEGFLRVRI